MKIPYGHHRNYQCGFAKLFSFIFTVKSSRITDVGISKIVIITKVGYLLII